MSSTSRIRDGLQPGVLAFVGAVAAVTAAGIAMGFSIWGPPDFTDAASFILVCVFAARRPLEVPSRPVAVEQVKSRPAQTLSGDFFVLMVAALATSPPTAALVGLVSALLLHHRKSLPRAIFNGSQTTLYAAGAAAVATVIRDTAGAGLRGELLAATLAGLTAIVLNTALVGVVVALERRQSILSVTRGLAWAAPNALGSVFLALLVATLYHEVGPASVLFAIAPLLIAAYARRARQEISLARDRTLRAFVRAVELKDSYTFRHSERVATIALALHRELGTPESRWQMRYFGALLHDLGKIAIPARILNKPGPLTPNEHAVVATHPDVGADTVREIRWLDETVPEVLHHHERIDGRGYPAGLVGDDIPFDARILAVADTLEALTSARPYRSAMSTEQALAVIREVAGTQLDAKVVSALERVVRKGHLFPSRETGLSEGSTRPQRSAAEVR